MSPTIDRPLKIGLAIYSFGRHRGGVERHVYGLAHGLLARGHRVTILCRHVEGDPNPEITVEKIASRALTAPGRWKAYAHRVAKIHAERRFDIVHGFGRTYRHDIYRVGGGVHREYLRRTADPETSAWRRRLQELRSRNAVANRLEERTFRGGECGRITCISRRVREEVHRTYGVPLESMRVIYNGIDPTEFFPSADDGPRRQFREAHGLPPEARIALFIGHGFRRKGLDVAIRAMASLEDTSARLAVVGSGSPVAFKRLAKDLGVRPRVLFLGPRKEIRPLLQAADTFLLPTRYEPFGTVCLEALACGLPVIVSSTAGAAEVIEPGSNGLVLADPEDPIEAARALKTIWSPYRPEAWRERAARSAERYTVDGNTEETLEVYREVVAAKGTAG